MAALHWASTTPALLKTNKINFVKSDHIPKNCSDLQDLERNWYLKTNNKKQKKNNNSYGQDEINIRMLKKLGNKATEYLAIVFENTINKNLIPMQWKTNNLVPIPKPNKDKNQSTSYRPIALISPLANILERILLQHMMDGLPVIPNQHGFKPGHSTTTALLEIASTIVEGFNKPKPPKRTIVIQLDMSKAYDMVDHH